MKREPIVTKHRFPYPPDIYLDEFENAEDWCKDTADDWICTRAAGHDGTHAAGGFGGIIHAEWTYK